MKIALERGAYFIGGKVLKVGGIVMVIVHRNDERCVTKLGMESIAVLRQIVEGTGMNKRMRKVKGVVKGAPSGFVISLLVHAAAFMLAGLLVVFNVVQKEEKKFVPPKPVDRPKMKLKKPKVKVKKSAKPKSTQRIVTKVQKASMPDIQLPEMSGIGDGLAGDIGGFEIMPNLDDVSVFGSSQSIGNDLVGTFYDFNRTRRGSLYAVGTEEYTADIEQFHKSGWKTSRLAKYYRSPTKLYATSLAVPPIPSPLGPAAFNEPDNQDRCWMVHYKGQLVHKDGIRFRFVGNSDDILAVRVDGEVVLDGSREFSQVDTSWLPDTADDRKWYMAHDYTAVGHIVELEPGVPKDIEIIFGERPGVLFNAILCVMEEGVEYEKNRFGAPILPIFKSSPLTRKQQDMIFRGMPEGEVDVIGGPVFNDFTSSTPEPSVAATEPVEEPGTEAALIDVVAEREGMRTWASTSGKTMEGEFMTRLGNEVVLKTARGRQQKIPMDQLSEEDRRYVSLAVPPKVKIDLGKTIRQRTLKHDVEGAVGINEYTFSPKIEVSDETYSHELKVDYWVIGSEIGASKYMLLDKGSESFVPAEQPNGRFTFSGNTIDLYDWVLVGIYQQRRGERYEGFLVTVTDERGVIIAQRSTPTWLFKNMSKLKKLELGAFLDNKCDRVWPTPLKSPR